ncbi:GDYXXLXY domain-containing protein [Bradyrhizobium sp. AUGA SZCCT0431]|uniref:GDYXXLXY domain-containing protein n=1 Tax=Bradyrhizobium sp. AUGA SZCCT0431 TaxID=2807674 RepID=UPI001BADDFA0|nr:GDYXXLXY domain-containing protein [Bradyrhizobium sp. AUGA SZCCT0431]MBR1141955.1 GDYXXLXY domain-containing protein [Bradyrhizobium sp. AUGA SZCCT0431]
MSTVDSLIGRVPLLPRYILAALLLCGLILAMVYQRAEILRNGREVRLEIVPVDPRDLFRGDYVVLDYRISSIDLPKESTNAFTRGQKVFVTLRPDETGKARAVAIASERPAVSGADIVILGTVDAGSVCPPNEQGLRVCKPGIRAALVKYGLESYFVPQGEGKKIETTEKARLEVVAAVTPSGQAAIKRLLIDGKPVYDEPPY